MGRRIVLAFGGNALCPEDCDGAYATQRAHARQLATIAGRLTAAGDQVLITHGNGPQAGQLAIQQENAADMVAAQPLFAVVGMTEGYLGHLLALGLREQVGQTRPIAALITHVVVDRDDPAFARPDKPIGPFYSAAEATRLAAERGWTVQEVGAGRYRRVVPSPVPRTVLELGAIRSLMAGGAMVVAAGGGGIPVVEEADGTLAGVDAVVDKDFAAERMASALDAEALVLVTDVPELALDFGTPQQRPVTELTASEASAHLEAGQFPPGSMGPKVTAAIDFVKNGGRMAVITSGEHVEAALAGRHGTRIVAA